MRMVSAVPGNLLSRTITHMRRFGMVLVIALIGVVVLAVAGPELPGSSIFSQAGQTLRDFAAAIAEWIGFSVRGFAPEA
jgi:hypothetical protein